METLSIEERAFWDAAALAFVRRASDVLPTEAACFADALVAERRKRMGAGGGGSAVDRIRAAHERGDLDEGGTAAPTETTIAEFCDPFGSERRVTTRHADGRVVVETRRTLGPLAMRGEIVFAPLPKTEDAS